MAAESVASIIIDRRESDIKTLPQRIASDDSAEWGSGLESHTFARLLERCDSLCMEPDAYTAEFTPIMKPVRVHIPIKISSQTASFLTFDDILAWVRGPGIVHTGFA